MKTVYKKVLLKQYKYWANMNRFKRKKEKENRYLFDRNAHLPVQEG